MANFLHIFKRIGVAIFCVVFLFSSLLQFASKRRFLLEPYLSTQAMITAIEPYITASFTMTTR